MVPGIPSYVFLYRPGSRDTGCFLVDKHTLGVMGIAGVEGGDIEICGLLTRVRPPVMGMF